MAEIGQKKWETKLAPILVTIHVKLSQT